MSNLEQLSREAFTRVNAACPEDAKTLGKYIAGLKQKNVMALGEGEAFTLTDAQGRQIKATRRSVKLTAQNGGLVTPVWNGPYVISCISSDLI